jgi:hypothetical protein
MSQPSVKFISHFASYLVFICLIITSNLKFEYAEKHLEKFSDTIGINHFKNFTKYIQNEYLIYRPKFTDFHIRPHSPDMLDIVTRFRKKKLFFLIFLI